MDRRALKRIIEDRLAARDCEELLSEEIGRASCRERV